MEKCLIAMSGGVDSAVAAFLLKEKGYDIAGATMKLLNNEESILAIEDAKKVCNAIGIKHYVFDLEEKFKNEVIDYFIRTYQLGKTPNPCVLCNKNFKFGYFYEEAQKLGYSLIATGHYAKILDGKLYRSKNLAKDQSYFLYGIKKEILNHVLFPLADITSKEEVRELAKKANLMIEKKKDSEDICFIPDSDYKKFLKEHRKERREGDICLEDGSIIGKHQGLEFYTIGQRKGLGISSSYPLYVIELDHKKNRVIVGKEETLMHDTLIASDTSFLVDNIPATVMAKVRSRGPLEEAKITRLDENKIKVIFSNKQRAITKGQSIVFYYKEQCLGGGIIEEVL